jgi:hypothetical protein
MTQGRFRRADVRGALAAARDVRGALPLLFLTGLASLAMEVVWIREFTPYLGPVVYSFATILAVYLAFNALGSRISRKWAAARERRSDAAAEWSSILIAAGLASLLPLVTADPQLRLDESVFAHALRILGIGPFCAAAGFLTPLLVDRWSGGDPDRAGRAYAVNVVGCILGPLIAGFWLLPWVGERWTLAILAAPLLVLGTTGVLRGGATPSEAPQRTSTFRWIAAAVTVVAALLLVFATRDYQSLYPSSQVRRDSTATVIAAGHGTQALDQRLRHHLADAGAEDDGASPGSVSRRAAEADARDLLRHGHVVSIPAHLGRAGHGGGVGTQRSGLVRLLPRRRPRTTSLSLGARGDRRRPTFPRARAVSTT